MKYVLFTQCLTFVSCFQFENVIIMKHITSKLNQRHNEPFFSSTLTTNHSWKYNCDTSQVFDELFKNSKVNTHTQSSEIKELDRTNPRIFYIVCGYNRLFLSSLRISFIFGKSFFYLNLQTWFCLISRKRKEGTKSFCSANRDALRRPLLIFNPHVLLMVGWRNSQCSLTFSLLFNLSWKMAPQFFGRRGSFAAFYF